MLTMTIHTETTAILEVLASCPVGETVTYDEVSEAIGRDIHRCRHYLVSALRMAQKQHGAVFETVIGTGYRRLPTEEIAKVAHSGRSRIRREAGRRIRTLVDVSSKANDMTPALQREVYTEQARFGLLAHVASMNQFPKAPKTATKAQPIAVTAREFLRSIGGLPEEE